MSTVSRWTTPAVFLDRDGTIIEDVGYVRDLSQVVFFGNTVQALGLLAEKTESTACSVRRGDGSIWQSFCIVRP